MASELSREEAVLEARRAIACLFIQTEESIVKDVRAKVESAFAAHDTHDDALRQQQTNNQLCIKVQADELGRLRQQLEHSQQLVTDGHEAIGHWQGEYEQLRQRVEELTNLQGQPQCWNVEHMELESKLATAQVRILELEQALRLHLAVAKDDPILLQHDRKEPS